MIFYFFFLILSFLPLIEGEQIGVAKFLFLAFCLPLAYNLYKSKFRRFTFSAIGKKKNVNPRNVVISFLLFLFFASLSIIFSSVWARSLSQLFLYFSYFIYFLSAQKLTLENKKSLKEFLIVSILFPSFILCLLSFFHLFIQEKPPFNSMNLIYANFGHNHLIDFLIFAFPVSIALFVKEKMRYKKYLYLALSVIFFTAFIASFSRGGIIILILTFILFEFLIFRKLTFKKQQNNIFNNYLKILYLFLFIILLLSFLGNKFLSEDKIKSLGVFKKAFRDLPFQSRIEYWRQSLFAFKEKPIFGWGLDNFRYASKQLQECPSCWSWYSHNHFLQMFVETGIFGGLTFIILITFITKNIFKNIFVFNCGRSEKRIQLDCVDVALGIGVVVSIVHSLFDYDWQFISVFLYFWVISGYLLKLRTKNLKLPVRNAFSIANAGGKTTTKKLKLNYLKRIGFIFIGLILFVVAILQFQSRIYIFLASEAKKKNNFLEAEEYYLDSIKIWPFNFDYYQTLINFYQEQNDFKKAAATIKSLLAIEPLSDRNYLLLSEFTDDPNLKIDYLFKVNSLSPADTVLNSLKILELWPKSSQDVEILYLALEQIEKAKGPNCVLKCIDFENEEKIEKLLFNLVENKKIENVTEEKQARIYYWLTVLTTYKKDWDQNIRYLEKSVKLDSKEEYNNLLDDLNKIKQILSLYEDNKYEQIKTLANHFNNKVNNHSFHEKFYLGDVYVKLGDIYYQEGNYNKAIEIWQTSLKINPYEEQIYLNLAKLYQEQNNLNKVKQILEDCVKVDEWKVRCQERLNKI